MTVTILSRCDEWGLFNSVSSHVVADRDGLTGPRAGTVPRRNGSRTRVHVRPPPMTSRLRGNDSPHGVARNAPHRHSCDSENPSDPHFPQYRRPIMDAGARVPARRLGDSPVRCGASPDVRVRGRLAPSANPTCRTAACPHRRTPMRAPASRPRCPRRLLRILPRGSGRCGSRGRPGGRRSRRARPRAARPGCRSASSTP